MATRITIGIAILLVITCAGLWVENGRLRNAVESMRMDRERQLLEAERLVDSLRVMEEEIQQYHGWYRAMEVEYDSLRAEYLRFNLRSHDQPPRPRPATATELRASMLRSIGR